MSKKILKEISERYFEELLGLQPTSYVINKDSSGMIGKAHFDDIKMSFYPEYIDESNYSIIIYLGLDSIDKITKRNHALKDKIFNKYDHEFYTTVCSENSRTYTLKKSSSYRFKMTVINGVKEETRKATYYIYTNVSTDSIFLSSFIIDCDERITYKDNFVMQFHWYRKAYGPKVTQRIMEKRDIKLTSKNLKRMEAIAYRNYIYTLDYYDKKIREHLPSMEEIYKMDVEQLKYTINSANTISEIVAY